MIASEPSQSINENQESFVDQNAIQNLKQIVCLNNHQLLQLTYNDQKFYQKLTQLNHCGCLHIQKLQYTEAFIYLTEAQKVLQYAASCGKTIQRKLIITTLNNQASLYQKAWELQKAQSYLQAIIYNISSFFQNNSDHQHADKSLQFTKNVFDKNSPQYQDFSISLWRKKSLVIFYLQYCAINSQNKNNERAFSSASKAVSLIKQISMDLYNYEKFVRQNSHQLEGNSFSIDSLNPKNFLYQLATFKQLDMKNIDFENFYKKAVKYIATYMKRLQNMENESEQHMETYKGCFENYSIGTIMQINPIQLDQQTDNVDLNQEISMIQKHFKGIYLSVGHFILGTQGRFIAAQKYTLDENQRKSSSQYKQSQIYHLYSIIILTKFLLCQSGYFDHIVNSFRNHYKLDILQDARKYLESNQNITDDDLLNDDQLYLIQNSQKKIPQQVQQIQKLQSQIKIVQQIPCQNQQHKGAPQLNLKTQESEELVQGPITPKQKGSRATKSTKQSKNTVSSQNGGKQSNPVKQHITAVKKSHTKKSINPLSKSQTRLHTQQANRVMVNSQHEHKNLQKAINLLTSREKQNKIKMTQNPKSSRSKRKSDYQFLTSNKKLHITNDKIGQKTTDKYESKRQTIYVKKQSDYLPSGTSRSKGKRIPTSNDGQKKGIRRKDSCGDLRKTKKVEQEYGILGSNKNIQLNKNQAKSSRNNLCLNIKDMKKSKHRKQSQDKIKLTSPQLKLKKLKSPRNIKK